VTISQEFLDRIHEVDDLFHSQAINAAQAMTLRIIASFENAKEIGADLDFESLKAEFLKQNAK
jgi:hypothetical protein